MRRQTDQDTRDIGRHSPVAVGIQADAREACLVLLNAVARDGACSPSAAWRQEAVTLKGYYVEHADQVGDALRAALCLRR